MNYDRKLPVLFIKTLVIAIITYIAMSFWYSLTGTTSHHQPQQSLLNRWKTTPTPSTSLQSEYLLIDNDLQKQVDLLNDEVHPVASSSSAESLKNLCLTYPSICDHTRFTTAISTKQRLYYQTLIIYIIKKMSALSVPVLDYIDIIEVDSYNAKSRWYSSRDLIHLDVKSIRSYQEFAQVLVHEIGHIVDFDHLIGEPLTDKSDIYTEFWKEIFPLDDPSLVFYEYSRSDEYTRRKNTSYKDFVSWYGLTDPFEDLAESINFYIYYNQIFAKLAKQSDVLLLKYQFVDQLFNGVFISDGLKKQSLFESTKREYRPYDTTRF